MRVDIHVEVSSKAPRETLKRYGYVLETEVNGITRTVEGFGEINGTYHKVILVAINAALIRMRKPSEIMIHTRDDFIANMAQNDLETWEKQNFMTAKGYQVANAAEWKLFLQLSKCHSLLGFTRSGGFFTWIESELKKRK